MMRLIARPRAICNRSRVTPALKLRGATRYYSVESAPEEITVNLDDENPPVANFFDYTWGHWLKDDMKQRALRETKFSLKGLLEVLKEKASEQHGPAAAAELEIKTIQAFSEGKHHKIYKVDLKDGREFALRIPYKLGSPEYRSQKIKSEVATIDFLKEKLGLDVPDIVAYSSNDKNPLGTAYQLMFFAPGEILMRNWHPQTHNMQAKGQIIKPIADFLDKMTSVEFTKYGSLYFTEDVSSSLQNDLAYVGAESDSAELADKWRIGPTVQSKFWKENDFPAGSLLRGPWTNFQDFMRASGEISLSSIKEMLQENSTSEDLTESYAAFQRYRDVSTLLFDQKLDNLDPKLFSPRLYTPDLSPMNVIQGSDGHGNNTFHFVDFEGASIRPFLLTGIPAFARHNGPKIFKKEEVPNYETLSDNDKRAIDHFMAMTQTQFAFEYYFAQTKSPLINAFAPSVKRRQNVYEMAMSRSVKGDEHLDLTEDLIRLSTDWEHLGLNRECPVVFTAAEIDQQAAEFDAYSQKILSNPFSSTKGWVPQGMFEHLKERGVIVADGDDWKLVDGASIF